MYLLSPAKASFIIFATIARAPLLFAVSQDKEGFVEPYWEDATLPKFEEFPSAVEEFPLSDDGSDSTSWTTLIGLDCYEGKGGDPILPDPLSSSMSPMECRAACLEDVACEGVVTSSGLGTGYCYKRRNLKLENCVKDSKWTLHKKKGGSSSSTWKIHVGLDCYEGKGGTPILPDPFSSSLSLDDCKTACLRDDACKGVVTRTGQNSGYCYKRRDLRLENCVKDPDWTLNEKKAGSTNPWLSYPGVDCYAGQGGDPILPDPHSKALSLAGCKSACEMDSSCEGIITQAGNEAVGLCYKRRNLQLSNCVNDANWNLFIKSGGPGGSTPRPPVSTSRPPSNNQNCKFGIQAYPRSLPNSHYYTRLCTSKDNLRIISASKASNAALERTAYLINSVMAYVDARVAQSMTARGFRHAVMAAYPAELTTHIPEHAWLGSYYNERARGLGATVALPVGSSAEENALCHSNDRYRSEDITIHEFAHSLHLLGFALVFPSFNSELTALYNAARSSGSWGSSHYAMTDFKEYFAEGVQSYFDANAPDYYGPSTREQLRSKDPGLYNLLVRYLGNNPWKRSCRPQRLQS